MKIEQPKIVNSTKPTTDNHHLIENENKKLTLSIKAKLNNIRIFCHKITIDAKEVPSLKTSNPTIKVVNRLDYWRAITTISINCQSNFMFKKDIRLLSLERQFKLKNINQNLSEPDTNPR